MTIQFTDDELYQLFLIVDSRCRSRPTTIAIDALREKLLPVYRAQHTPKLTLEELQRETLVEKHSRLKQERCLHEEIYSSTVYGPDGAFTNKFCLDCGKSNP